MLDKNARATIIDLIDMQLSSSASANQQLQELRDLSSDNFSLEKISFDEKGQEKKTSFRDFVIEAVGANPPDSAKAHEVLLELSSAVAKKTCELEIEAKGYKNPSPERDEQIRASCVSLLHRLQSNQATYSEKNEIITEFAQGFGKKPEEIIPRSFYEAPSNSITNDQAHELMRSEVNNYLAMQYGFEKEEDKANYLEYLKEIVFSNSLRQNTTTGDYLQLSHFFQGESGEAMMKTFREDVLIWTSLEQAKIGVRTENPDKLIGDLNRQIERDNSRRARAEAALKAEMEKPINATPITSAPETKPQTIPTTDNVKASQPALPPRNNPEIRKTKIVTPNKTAAAINTGASQPTPVERTQVRATIMRPRNEATPGMASEKKPIPGKLTPHLNQILDEMYANKGDGVTPQDFYKMLNEAAFNNEYDFEKMPKLKIFFEDNFPENLTAEQKAIKNALRRDIVEWTINKPMENFANNERETTRYNTLNKNEHERKRNNINNKISLELTNEDDILREVERIVNDWVKVQDKNQLDNITRVMYSIMDEVDQVNYIFRDQNLGADLHAEIDKFADNKLHAGIETNKMIKTTAYRTLEKAIKERAELAKAQQAAANPGVGARKPNYLQKSLKKVMKNNKKTNSSNEIKKLEAALADEKKSPLEKLKIALEAHEESRLKIMRNQQDPKYDPKKDPEVKVQATIVESIEKIFNDNPKNEDLQTRRKYIYEHLKNDQNAILHMLEDISDMVRATSSASFSAKTELPKVEPNKENATGETQQIKITTKEAGIAYANTVEKKYNDLKASFDKINTGTSELEKLKFALEARQKAIQIVHGLSKYANYNSNLDTQYLFEEIRSDIGRQIGAIIANNITNTGNEDKFKDNEIKTVGEAYYKFPTYQQVNDMIGDIEEKLIARKQSVTAEKKDNTPPATNLPRRERIRQTVIKANNHTGATQSIPIQRVPGRAQTMIRTKAPGTNEAMAKSSNSSEKRPSPIDEIENKAKGIARDWIKSKATAGDRLAIAGTMTNPSKEFQFPRTSLDPLVADLINESQKYDGGEARVKKAMYSAILEEFKSEKNLDAQEAANRKNISKPTKEEIKKIKNSATYKWHMKNLADIERLFKHTTSDLTDVKFNQYCKRHKIEDGLLKDLLKKDYDRIAIKLLKNKASTPRAATISTPQKEKQKTGAQRADSWLLEKVYDPIIKFTRDNWLDKKNPALGKVKVIGAVTGATALAIAAAPFTALGIIIAGGIHLKAMYDNPKNPMSTKPVEGKAQQSNEQPSGASKEDDQVKNELKNQAAIQANQSDQAKKQRASVEKDSSVHQQAQVVTSENRNDLLNALAEYKQYEGKTHIAALNAIQNNPSYQAEYKNKLGKLPWSHKDVDVVMNEIREQKINEIVEDAKKTTRNWFKEASPEEKKTISSAIDLGNAAIWEKAIPSTSLKSNLAELRTKALNSDDADPFIKMQSAVIGQLTELVKAQSALSNETANIPTKDATTAAPAITSVAAAPAPTPPATEPTLAPLSMPTPPVIENSSISSSAKIAATFNNHPPAPTPQAGNTLKAETKDRGEIPLDREIVENRVLNAKQEIRINMQGKEINDTELKEIHEKFCKSRGIRELDGFLGKEIKNAMQDERNKIANSKNKNQATPTPNNNISEEKIVDDPKPSPTTIRFSGGGR